MVDAMITAMANEVLVRHGFDRNQNELSYEDPDVGRSFSERPSSGLSTLDPTLTVASSRSDHLHGADYGRADL